MRNPVSNLVYAANGSDVDILIVDGKIVMEGRELKTMVEREIIEGAQEVGFEADRRLGLQISSNWPTKWNSYKR